jgi:hypothetical protein
MALKVSTIARLTSLPAVSVEPPDPVLAAVVAVVSSPVELPLLDDELPHPASTTIPAKQIAAAASRRRRSLILASRVKGSFLFSR